MFIFSWKNYLCFSKFKCFPVINLPPPPSSKQPQNPSTTTTTLINNFNSLDHDLTTSTSNSSDDHSSSEYTDEYSLPDFATVFASQRFFFSSPGHSNSIFHSPLDPDDNILVAGSIAVQTYSPDPFQDFRKSMQEMVEARELTDVEADWDFLHELLLCYLTLNPKHTHKFIIKAFSDLIISLMPSESCRRIEDRHHSTTSQRLV